MSHLTDAGANNQNKQCVRREKALLIALVFVWLVCMFAVVGSDRRAPLPTGFQHAEVRSIGDTESVNDQRYLHEIEIFLNGRGSVESKT